MAKYKAITVFKDLQDENYIYRVGDKFPRKGRAKKERVEELMGSDNLIGKPVLCEVEEGDE